MDGKYNESKMKIGINDFISPGRVFELDLNNYGVKPVKKTEIPDKTFKSEDYAQD